MCILMKLSDFESKLIDALIKDDPEEETIRNQLVNARVEKREYTGVGLYTDIIVSENNKKISKSNRYIQETPKAHLVHPKLKDGAGALLWFNEGYVSTLECYTYEGDWPENESLFAIST
ncbi:hypothetical protein PN36_30155 [Candidatus Thiomargarita nelsonii]|uniref:Uncharacterized protein n=1 Tax=Candidatus Thiomargarita nelsonii TaxID=1003181 RepID=A0A0A6P9N4_9GAMM|nr:hypothetical protein PN36_30155 [Candidatus Thiomargarita nelsonii]